MSIPAELSRKLQQLARSWPRYQTQPPPVFQKQQQELLLAMLRHVEFDGWSIQALKRAAKDCQLEPQHAAALFPHAQSSDFIRFANHLINQRCLEQLRRTQNRLQQQGKRKLGITAQVDFVLTTRIQSEAQHYRAAQRALNQLLLPGNLSDSLLMAWQTSDSIWQAIVGNKVDAGYYSRRAILAGVIISTWPVWLSSNQAKPEKAIAFMRRQLSRSLAIGSFFRDAKGGMGSKGGSKSRILRRMQYRISEVFNPEAKRFRNLRRGLK